MTTEEKLQAILNAMPLSTDGINNAMNEPYQFVDKLGITAVIDEIMDRMPGSGASNPLPAPTVEFVIYGSGDKGLMKLTLGYSELGDVKVVMANGRAPTASDPEVTPEGTLVDANGTYQIVALQQDITYPQGSSYTTIKEISNLKCQKPKISYDEDTYTVTLTAVTEGSTIRYTTDGTEPTETSTAYSAPFTIAEAKTITAKAFKTGITPSDSVVGKYDVASVIAVQFLNGAFTGTRLTPETDPLGVVTETITQEPQIELLNNQTGYSVFDNYKPWQKKRRNFVKDETGRYIPGPWDGDYGFSVTENDVMVYYPACYIRFTYDVGTKTEGYYISDRNLSGFEKAPWSESYSAAYKTADSFSLSGKISTGSTIGDAISNARTKGENWSIEDAVSIAADRWLIFVEFAKKDGRDIFGIRTNSIQTTGVTDSLSYHTGSTGATLVSSQDNTRFRYRWTEDIYDNGISWIAGIRIFKESDNKGALYITTDPDLYLAKVPDGYTMLAKMAGDGAISSNYTYSFYINSIDLPWFTFMPDPYTTSVSEQLFNYYQYVPSEGYFCTFCPSEYRNLYSFSISYSDSNDGFRSRLVYRETKVFTPEITAA